MGHSASPSWTADGARRLSALARITRPGQSHAACAPMRRLSPHPRLHNCRAPGSPPEHRRKRACALGRPHGTAYSTSRAHYKAQLCAYASAPERHYLHAPHAPHRAEMEIARLLNLDDGGLRGGVLHHRVPVAEPAPKTERAGKRRVEKACPACGERNHIRTTRCRFCDVQLRVSHGNTLRAARAARAAQRAAKQRRTVAIAVGAPPPLQAILVHQKTLAKPYPAASPRTSRPCPTCKVPNHIRVTVCVACRRALRPPSA